LASSCLVGDPAVTRGVTGWRAPPLPVSPPQGERRAFLGLPDSGRIPFARRGVRDYDAESGIGLTNAATAEITEKTPGVLGNGGEDLLL
jgi:hypothetical protein